MQSLGRRIAAAVALSTVATALVILTSATPTTAATTLRCESVVGGVTPSQRMRFVNVVNGKVVKTRATTTPLPFDPSATAFKSFQGTASTVTVGTYAIHPSGTPRVIGTRYAPSGTSMTWTSRPTTLTGFLPRLFAGSGYHYFTVSDTGVLHRVDENLRNPKGIGTGYGNLTAIQWASAYSIQGVGSYDILYATTDAGALLQIQVPFSNPAAEKVVTLRTTGFTGVTGLSTGWCNESPFHHTINAIFGGEKRATWTTVTRAPEATWKNTTVRGAVSSGYDWRLHAVH